MIHCDNYICFEKIGIGCSCIVFHAYHKETKEEVAIKLINKDRFPSLKLSPFNNEISMLKSLKHPNVVSLVSFSDSVACVNSSNERLQMSYLGLEFLSQGDLFLYISKTGPFCEKFSRFLFHQLLEGLEYIHSNQVFHKDIKPENLMFDLEFTLKIVDFGLATTEEFTRSTSGTVPYMLPEIFRKDEYESSSADLFAAGVVLFNMVTSQSPFLSATPHDQLYKLLGTGNHGYFWSVHEKMNQKQDIFSEELKSLLNLMLSANPFERPCIEEIKASDWYKGSLPSKEEFRQEMAYRSKLLSNSDSFENDPRSTIED
ncbi:unnamed protein product [Moneuplotes crassus]|uniref:non-specific serine/threonine protein kinase n=1 Tax=Euplotes crassus TaxID=5936 RepID=A0AAD1XND4_EUPCR|nr:unnamed protein product [Moneuplotes crassus]